MKNNFFVIRILLGFCAANVPCYALEKDACDENRSSQRASEEEQASSREGVPEEEESVHSESFYSSYDDTSNEDDATSSLESSFLEEDEPTEVPGETSYILDAQRALFRRSRLHERDGTHPSLFRPAGNNGGFDILAPELLDLGAGARRSRISIFILPICPLEEVGLFSLNFQNVLLDDFLERRARNGTNPRGFRQPATRSPQERVSPQDPRAAVEPNAGESTAFSRRTAQNGERHAQGFPGYMRGRHSQNVLNYLGGGVRRDVRDIVVLERERQALENRLRRLLNRRIQLEDTTAYDRGSQ